MDNLEDLPLPKKPHISQEEETLLNRYFGSSPPPDEKKRSWTKIAISIGVTVLSFMALVNPISNGIFEYFSDSAVVIFILKTILFLIVEILLQLTL